MNRLSILVFILLTACGGPTLPEYAAPPPPPSEACGLSCETPLTRRIAASMQGEEIALALETNDGAIHLSTLTAEALNAGEAGTFVPLLPAGSGPLHGMARRGEGHALLLGSANLEVRESDGAATALAFEGEPSEVLDASLLNLGDNLWVAALRASGVTIWRLQGAESRSFQVREDPCGGAAHITLGAAGPQLWVACAGPQGVYAGAFGAAMERLAPRGEGIAVGGTEEYALITWTDSHGVQGYLRDKEGRTRGYRFDSGQRPGEGARMVGAGLIASPTFGGGLRLAYQDQSEGRVLLGHFSPERGILLSDHGRGSWMHAMDLAAVPAGTFALAVRHGEQGLESRIDWYPARHMASEIPASTP